MIAMAVFSGLLALENSPTHTHNKGSKTASVERTKEEWKKILSPEQFRILREAGTERPNGKIYLEFKEQGAGTYYCAGCDTELFSSKEKFDSHCGWPSFYDPSKAKNNLNWDIKTSFKELVKLMVEGDLELAEKEKVLFDNGMLKPTWEHPTS